MQAIITAAIFILVRTVTSMFRSATKGEGTIRTATASGSTKTSSPRFSGLTSISVQEIWNPISMRQSLVMAALPVTRSLRTIRSLVRRILTGPWSSPRMCGRRCGPSGCGTRGGTRLIPARASFGAVMSARMPTRKWILSRGVEIMVGPFVKACMRGQRDHRLVLPPSRRFMSIPTPVSRGTPTSRAIL